MSMVVGQADAPVNAHVTCANLSEYKNPINAPVQLLQLYAIKHCSKPELVT